MAHTVTLTKLPACNFCSVNTAAVDGKSRFGPWGFMCTECFPLYGVGIGTGLGQVLTLDETTAAEVAELALALSR
jgi:hypothetical protein